MTECELPLDDSIDIQLGAFAGLTMEVRCDPILGHPADRTVYEIDSLVSNDELEKENGGQPNVVHVSSERVILSKVRSYIIVGVLFLVNLLNYMDRFTVAGVLEDIKLNFSISDVEAGLLQTSFIVVYMLASPVFGFLGDRYRRKYIMIFGILFWCVVTMASSFIPSNMFALFVVFRGLVGMGEASYSTVAPTIIADMFTDDKRKLMLMLFYFAIPVGSGLGYVIGTGMSSLFHDWRYALRFTPFLGVACLVLLWIFVVEPHRGEAEGGASIRTTSYLTDIKALVRNKSFMLSTFGFTCVAFVAGALSFWAPLFMISAQHVQNQRYYRMSSSKSLQAEIGLIFGGITVAAGFLGVALGSESARRLRKINPRADPLVCAFGLLCCTPFLFFALILAKYNAIAVWILIFFGELSLCLNWAIVADMLLYVVIPTRRSTAEAFQILISHLLGDAGSPFLIGAISSGLKPAFHSRNQLTEFTTLQYGMYLTPFACVVGGCCFLFTALFIERDRDRVLKVVEEAQADEHAEEIAR